MSDENQLNQQHASPRSDMENVPKVVVEVQPTVDDMHEVWNGSRARYLPWVLFLIGAYYGYMAVAEIVNCGICPDSVASIAIYGAAAGIAFVGGIFLPRFRSRQIFRHGPTIQASRQFSLSSQGVHIDSELMTCNLRWGGLMKISETRGAFLLFQSPFAAWVIPKRSFADPNDLARIRDIFRANFGGRLLLLG